MLPVVSDAGSSERRDPAGSASIHATVDPLLELELLGTAGAILGAAVVARARRGRHDQPLAEALFGAAVERVPGSASLAACFGVKPYMRSSRCSSGADSSLLRSGCSCCGSGADSGRPVAGLKPP